MKPTREQVESIINRYRTTKYKHDKLLSCVENYLDCHVGYVPGLDNGIDALLTLCPDLSHDIQYFLWEGGGSITYEDGEEIEITENLETLKAALIKSNLLRVESIDN